MKLPVPLSDQSELPTGHYVQVGLPGSEQWLTDYRDPVVKHVQRINHRKLESPPRGPDPRDVAAIRAWLNLRIPASSPLR